MNGEAELSPKPLHPLEPVGVLCPVAQYDDWFAVNPLRASLRLLPRCVRIHATKAEKLGLSPFGLSSAASVGLVLATQCQLRLDCASVRDSRCEVRMYLPCSHCTSLTTDEHKPPSRIRCPGTTWFITALACHS